MNPDPVDRRLLQLLQDEFPLETDPWGALGEKLGITGREVLQRVRSLEASGVLRGICPVLESRKAGIGASTLVALHVPPGMVDKIARIISGYPQVSHNYLRDHRYNLWFTLGARDREELEQVLRGIRERCGLNGSDFIELPAKRRFKIDVRFPVHQEEAS
jgi:DNA-binding Lrp family transcriptional regulator